ncbi:MAG TPA: SGNH/GDSL hydrolase family protein [Candidatus Acidoferrum sp.]|nr:SGNH/GDSL hydrolase family protein [Candidatus Acidoferrum sp.]
MNANSESNPVARPARWKRLLQNLSLSAAAFLMCLAVLELVLRLCGYGNLEIYEPDPKLYWRLKPNQDCYTKIDHKPVHVNAQGARGPEFQVAKPTNTIRILSLGDSRTFGWGLSDAETYSRRLEGLLQAYVGLDRRVEVINAGVNAWSYSQMLVYFRDFGLRYQPDFVILADANLWTEFSEKNSPEFVKKFMWRVRLKNFLRRFAMYHFVVEVELRKAYEKERLKFLPVDPAHDMLFKEQQQRDPGAVYRDAIAGVCLVAQTNHIKALLLYVPTLDQLTAAGQRSSLLQIKRAVSTEFAAPQVDMTPELQLQGKALYLDADPVHLNAQGNAIVAERLFETITNMLAK